MEAPKRHLGPYGMRLFCWLGICAALSWAGLQRAAAASSADENNEYQFNLNTYHPLWGQLKGYGNWGYYYQPDNYSRYRFGWPGLIYPVLPTVQLLGGLDSYYTVNFHAADTLELRPYGGVKLLHGTKGKITLYNLTRYEYRSTQNQTTHQWDDYGRIRSRFGLEIPLASLERAWDPKTFYALADVEPFYRLDKNEWDPVRIRGGLGYVFSDRCRLEFIYTAQFSRDTSSSALAFQNNMLTLNLRIGLEEGLIRALLNPN